MKKKIEKAVRRLGLVTGAHLRRKGTDLYFPVVEGRSIMGTFGKGRIREQEKDGLLIEDKGGGSGISEKQEM